MFQTSDKSLPFTNILIKNSSLVCTMVLELVILF